MEFSIGRIPVLVRPAFFLLAVIFGASAGSAEVVAAWVAIVFASVLIHELGHAVAMRAFGFAPNIELHAMGGFTAWSLEKQPTPGQRVIVTFSGPLAGLVLGGLCVAVQQFLPADAPPLLIRAVGLLVWANIGWSLINLLPVLPWDGGLIVDAGAELVAKRPLPKVAAVSSVLFGGAVLAYAIYERQVLLGYFGAMGLYQAYLRFAPAAPKDASIDRVWALIQEQKFADAERLALDQAMVASDATSRGALYEAVAWSRLFRDDWPGAERAIEKMAPVKPQLNLQVWLAAHTGRHADVLALVPSVPSDLPLARLRAEALIASGKADVAVHDALALLAKSEPEAKQIGAGLAAALFHARAWEPSLQVSLAAFDVLNAPVHLVNAACALVKLGKPDEGLEMVKRAVAAGYADRKHLDDDPDLAPLRSMPGWP